MSKYCLSFVLIGLFFFASAQDKKFAQPDLPGDLMMDIGLNYWSNDNDTIRSWASKSLGVYYTQRIRISDKFSFYPAVGLGFERYGFKKNYYLNNGDDGIVSVDTLNAQIRKNKLAVTYFDVPLELRFHPQGTIDGEGFFIGAGVIGGIKMGAHTKLKYTQDGNRRKEKLRSNFGLEDFRYGVQFRVGWKSFHFFYKHYFSETFREGQEILDPDLQPTGRFFKPTPTTVGINFTGF